MNQDTGILTTLNAPQSDAVTAHSGPVLVLAGAGSGKTRVLVHRIAWLIQHHQVPPHQILAVTFTNKAAREMKVRIQSILPHSLQGMWVGTFHGLANRLLRAHHEQANLPRTFQILDSADQLQIIKRIVADLEMDPKRWQPKQFQWMISHHKEQGHRAEHVDANDDYLLKHFLKVYHAYEKVCERTGVVDFSELLLRAHELLLNNPLLLSHYQHRFQHVLVDEFQDTNKIQYAWLRILAQQHQSIFAVGDDDQSIYGWRGAEIENIRGFEQTYPDSITIRLEQNYRSSGHILGVANTLIANNSTRLGKNLWTDAGDGEFVLVYDAHDEVDEARYVIEKIQTHHDDHRYQDMAILYRSNAQSRLFEEQLRMSGIAYRVYGGLRFFDRKEIKDVLAYIRLTANPHDDAAFERVVNRPTRGIGAKCLSHIQAQARAQDATLWAAANALLRTATLAPRTRNAVKKFTEIIELMQQQTKELSVKACVEHVIETSGLQATYDKEAPETAATRKENLAELVNAAAQVDQDVEDGDDPLAFFLSFTALDSGAEEAEEQDCVQLMTLHSAKGLEFPVVFMTGLEDGLFPSSRSMDDQNQLDEERRLCYVGVTRAMQQLHITYAHVRRLYGDVKYTTPSRFLHEMPDNRLLTEQTQTQTSVFHEQDDTGDLPFQLGQRVSHRKFGHGVILNIDMQGRQTNIEVNFSKVGRKRLNLEYANLQPIYS